MPSPRLTIPVSAGGTNPNQHRLTLTQDPVSTLALTLDALPAMLSLARSGISALEYLAQACPATMSANIVTIPLTIYAWPSHRQDYSLSATNGSMTAIGEGESIEEEREFDLVVESTDAVDLPCLAAGITVTWQSPAILADGREIEPPAISGYDVDQGRLIPLAEDHGPVNRLILDRACFCVLRIRCRAIGYSHSVTLSVQRVAGFDASDIEETITASWLLEDGTTDATSIELDIPGCVEVLLNDCYDGSSVGAHLSSSSVTDTQYRTRVRFSTCTGKVIDVRQVEVTR